MGSVSAYQAHIAATGYVIRRLEEAGATLMALPGGNGSASLPSGMPDVVRSACEAYGWSDTPVRLPRPSAKRISEMEEALTWPGLIPAEQLLERRIVGARMLVHPVTGRHRHSWRRLGSLLGLEHKLVQRRHADGIATITARLGNIFPA